MADFWATFRSIGQLFIPCIWSYGISWKIYNVPSQDQHRCLSYVFFAKQPIPFSALMSTEWYLPRSKMKFHFIGLLFVCFSYVLTSTILPSTTTMQRVLLRCPWYWKFRTLANKYKALKYFEKYMSNSVDTYVTLVWITAVCHVDSKANTLTITERMQTCWPFYGKFESI